MEEYKIEQVSIDRIKHGVYTAKAFKKHEIDYGKKGAENILKNSRSIFLSINNDLLRKKETNMLLVGRVQSGKTSNLEMLTAIAFDNGYNSVIIYGGYDSVLLEQTTQRFMKTFEVSDDSLVHVFSTSDSNELLNIDKDIINTIINEDDGKIIFVTMKRVGALSKINSVLNTLNCEELKIFIIDDEGDQASLNTEFKKMTVSPTYNQIVQMKDLLLNPLYLSVTATPQALIFSPKLSRLRPYSSRLILPGNGYTGADSFHIKEGNVVRVDDSTEDIKLEKLPTSLLEAINYFLIASALMRKRSINSSDMIIHCAKEMSIHVSLYTNIENYLSNFKDNIKYNNADLFKRKKTFEEMFFNPKYFTRKTISQIDFDAIWAEICFIVTKIYLVMQNSTGKITMANLNLRKYKIFIGGDLLQRGITFKKLVTTYFTRWPKTIGNMDTTLQRARWFGYRNDYLDLCKIFCTDEIAFKYSRLTEIDNDIWEQFESIERDELAIADIIIDENDTNLRPARGNVVDIKTFSFRKKWLNQSIGTYNLNDVKYNNELFENLISKYEFCPTSIGRNDDKESAWFAEIKKEDVIAFIEKSKVIFNNHPFGKSALIKAFGIEKINMELFWNTKEKNNYRKRERSFTNEMKVSALQQGADTTDLNKRKYLGDSHVIVNADAITIQVFRILPIIEGSQDFEREQFMFSIHFPIPRKAYQWNK